MKVSNIRLIHWLAILLFVGFVLAQDNSKDTTTDAATTTATNQDTQKSSVAETTTDDKTTAESATGDKTTAESTTGDKTTAKQTTTAGDSTTKDATTTTAETAKTTASTKADSTSAAATTQSTSISYSAIKITAINTNNNGNSNAKPTLSKMPTLSTTGVPVPTVTVPSNEFNPFLKQQHAPEGTVFIAVGSVLGAFALAVIAWNVALAIIHRRNTRHFHDIGSDPTPLMTEIKDPNIGYNGGNSGAGAGGNSNLEHGGGVGLFGAQNKEASRSRSMINSGLFFSPTAQVLNSAQVQNANSANPSITSSMASTTAGVGIIGGPGRASVYMPAGYYEGSGNNGARSVRHMSMYSMSNASMAGGGHQPTPPPGAASMLSVPNSASNLRISQLATGEQQQQPRQSVRAPSAYLDDFLGFDK